MENLFVPYEIAKQLKEKGFDEPCLMVYYGEGKGLAESGQPMDKLFLPAGFGKVQNSHLKNFPQMKVYDLGQVTAPIYQQVIDWLREKHDIHLWVTTEVGATLTYCWVFTGESRGSRHKAYFKSYYEALNDGIAEALKLIKA